MKKLLPLFLICSLFIASILSFNAFSATATIGPCQDKGCVEYYKKYKKYARMGYADAMVTLAEMHYYGHGTKIDMKKALKQFRNAAKYGSAKGQYKAAMMYFNDPDLVDLEQGVKYLKKAARNNSAGSSFLLGIMYFDPDYYEQDFSESDKWLTKAYQRGFTKMPVYIDFMKKSPDFTEANFPSLIQAIKDTPIAVASVIPDSAEETKTVQKESKSVTKTSSQTAVNTPKSDTEVITVYSNLNDILDSQLASFRYTTPEKGSQNTGSRIIGKTCAQTMSCAPTSEADFKRGVRLVMGDRAVATFAEAFRGKSGF
jgi:hypothetical protein